MCFWVNFFDELDEDDYDNDQKLPRKRKRPTKASNMEKLLSHITETAQKRADDKKLQNEKRDQLHADNMELGRNLINVMQSLVSKINNEAVGKEMASKKMKNEDGKVKSKKMKYVPVTDSDTDTN